MNAKQKIHQAKLDQWASLIKDQIDSGLSVKEWCSLNGHSFHQYNYWKRPVLMNEGLQLNSVISGKS